MSLRNPLTVYPINQARRTLRRGPVDQIILCITFILAVPTAVLLLECGVAMLPAGRRREAFQTTGTAPRIAILMPAHNEEAGITDTIANLLPQLSAGDRIVVIADNCADDTATAARAAGAEVLERFDDVRRGKGYALDHGMRHLELDPPQVVVIVDADCHVNNGSLARISRASWHHNRPVQAVYLMQQPDNPGPKETASALAFMVRSQVRQTGLARLGMPCLLGGTGMAFPWKALHGAPLASGNIVEDMQLGLDLAVSGFAPQFDPLSRVTSQLPQQSKAAKSQRTRWEHGQLVTLLTQVPHLLKESVRQRRIDLVALAFDLCVPPLSLLVLLWVALLAASCVDSAFTGSWSTTAGIAAWLSSIGAIVALSWLRYGRQTLPFFALASAPFYVLWKIPIYLAFLVKRQKAWVRTARDPRASAGVSA